MVKIEFITSTLATNNCILSLFIQHLFHCSLMARRNSEKGFQKQCERVSLCVCAVHWGHEKSWRETATDDSSNSVTRANVMRQYGERVNEWSGRLLLL